MKIKFNIKGVVYGVIALLMIVGGFIFIPNMFMDKSEPVEYTMVQREAIPEKILNMMDKYVDQERALAVKLDNKIYVIVTRAEGSEQGIEINKVSIRKEENREIMKVEAVYKDKEKAHPYVVAETNLKELPDKIELSTSVEESK